MSQYFGTDTWIVCFAFQRFHNEISIYLFAFSLKTNVPNACKYKDEVISAHMPVHISLSEYRNGFREKDLSVTCKFKVANEIPHWILLV
jgi:hypothetical protein